MIGGLDDKFCRYVLDNSTDFETKLQRLVNLISKLVGLPTNLSRRSAKYLLRQRPDPRLFPASVDFHMFEVEKVRFSFSEVSVLVSLVRKVTFDSWIV
jgi:hypothetical protein